VHFSLDVTLGDVIWITGGKAAPNSSLTIQPNTEYFEKHGSAGAKYQILLAIVLNTLEST